MLLVQKTQTEGTGIDFGCLCCCEGLVGLETQTLQCSSAFQPRRSIRVWDHLAAPPRLCSMAGTQTLRGFFFLLLFLVFFFLNSIFCWYLEPNKLSCTMTGKSAGHQVWTQASNWWRNRRITFPSVLLLSPTQALGRVLKCFSNDRMGGCRSDSRGAADHSHPQQIPAAAGVTERELGCAALQGQELGSAPLLLCSNSSSPQFFPYSVLLHFLLYPNSSSCSILRSQRNLGVRCTTLVTLYLGQEKMEWESQGKAADLGMGFLVCWGFFVIGCFLFFLVWP